MQAAAPCLRCGGVVVAAPKNAVYPIAGTGVAPHHTAYYLENSVQAKQDGRNSGRSHNDHSSLGEGMTTL